MSPVVSVLMCACNSEKTIEDAVSSILNQSFRDFEFVIVENGSVDKTWDLLLEFEKNDRRIKLHRTNIRQLTFNLNYGLNCCSGEYILRMDSDDISLPNRISTLLNAILRNNKLCVVGSWYQHFDFDDKLIKLPVRHDEIFSRMPFRGSICHPSVLIRKSTLLNVGGYEGMRFVEDIDLWLKLRNTGAQFENVPLPLLEYRIHSNQSRGRKSSYFALAGLFLREAFLYRRPLFMVGSLLALAKGVLLGKNV